MKPVINKRILRVFLPFILLLLSFAALFLGQQLNSRDTTRGEVEGTSITIELFEEDGSIAEKSTPVVINYSTATPTASIASQKKDETAVSIKPTQIPNGLIQLIGPPSDSIFSLNTPITIYWDWPLDQKQSQQFSVYLFDDSGEYLAGTTDEPSLGVNGYQLNFIPGDVINSEGAYLFQIRLEQKNPFVILNTSKSRAIIITPDLSG